MHVVFGASGKVGTSSAEALRKARKAVRAVVRRPSDGEYLKRIGCEVMIADLADTTSLRRALEGAHAVQLICPVAYQAADPVAAMRTIILNVAQALASHPHMHVLAVSDYGAEIESGTGITMLYREFEQALVQTIPYLTLLRSAEHMQNWARVMPVAIATGHLPTLRDPSDVRFPTVSAHDVGDTAAQLLQEEEMFTGVRVVSVEGPQRYSADDAANLLSEICAREVRAYTMPRGRWAEMLRQTGIGDVLATLVMETNDAQNDGRIDAQAGIELRRGATGLRHVLAALASN